MAVKKKNLLDAVMAVFKKKGPSDAEQYFEEVLGWLEEQVVITRIKDCKRLYANAAAKAKQLPSAASGQRCGYSEIFPELCKRCPCRTGALAAKNGTIELVDLDGSVFSARIRSVQWPGERPAIMIILQDITEQRHTEKQLYTLAYFDPLTNLPNRRRFLEDFEAVAGAISAGTQTGIMAMFDLDNFKSVNDTAGHHTGDLMLRRLAESLSDNPNFGQHLYRLGGDEFILLMHEKAGRFPTEEAMTAHYTELLSELLHAYTIPNIDLVCTLSIGVSVFPKHGTTASELLRKADIALYQSKNAGGRRLSVFEDRYDRAKKFKDLFINIQPILTASGQTFGYELVDQSNPAEGDPDVVNLTDINRTLDALGLEDLNSSIRYLINYTEQLLSPVVLNGLHAGNFIVLLQIQGQLTAADMSRMLKLRKNNYQIALSGIHSADATPEVLKNAAYCRFNPADKNTPRQKRIILANPNVHFIAPEIHSLEAFERAKADGYRLFQGYYFNEPVVTKKTKSLDPIPANFFRLVQLTSTPDYVNFREISDIISTDVALSYRLLRLLNSAAVGLRNVSSIPMAVSYLGEENLKKWVGLLALRGIASDKPLELVRLSLVRARFGELLAPYIAGQRGPQHLFLLGMLSLLHVAMEITREELLSEISVVEEVRDSLLTKTGPYSAILKFFEHYEYANWEDVSRFAAERGITSELINDCYISAVKWYNNLTLSG